MINQITCFPITPMNRRLILIPFVFFCFAVALLASGCGNFRLWGAKTGSSSAHLGGDISIPLGK